MSEINEKKLYDMIQMGSTYSIKGRCDVQPVCIARSSINGLFGQYNVIAKSLHHDNIHYSYPWETFIKHATKIKD